MSKSTSLPVSSSPLWTLRSRRPSPSTFLPSLARDYRTQLHPGRRTHLLHASPARTRESLRVSCAIADTRRLSPLKLENILTPEASLLPPNQVVSDVSGVLLQGKIHSNVEETTKASVFAIFDEHKKLQYIGFSKGLEDSLRTVFTRRPDKAHFYKSVNLTKLDQKEMITIRDAWFEEVGGPPNGNKRRSPRRARMRSETSLWCSGNGESSLAAASRCDSECDWIQV